MKCLVLPLILASLVITGFSATGLANSGKLGACELTFERQLARELYHQEHEDGEIANIDNLFDRIADGLGDGGDLNSTADVVSLIFQNANVRSCNCVPGLFVRTSTYFLAGLNKLINKATGIATHELFVIERQINAELAQSVNNYTHFKNIVQRYRNSFMDVFTKSIEADLAYARSEIHVFNLQKAGESLYPNSKVIQKLVAFSKLEKEIRNIMKELWGYESLDIAALRLQERYLKLILEKEKKIAEFVALRTEIFDLRKTWRRLIERDPMFAFEQRILDEWVKRDKLQTQSQTVLAEFYVAMETLNILERKLDGELNRLQTTVDAGRLQHFVSFIDENKHFLNNSSIFARYYEHQPLGGGNEATDNNDVLNDPNKSSIEKFRVVREMGKAWSNLWQERLQIITPRIKFNYALTNLSMNVGPFMSGFTLASQHKTAMRGLSWFFDRLRAMVPNNRGSFDFIDRNDKTYDERTLNHNLVPVPQISHTISTKPGIKNAKGPNVENNTREEVESLLGDFTAVPVVFTEMAEDKGVDDNGDRIIRTTPLSDAGGSSKPPVEPRPQDPSSPKPPIIVAQPPSTKPIPGQLPPKPTITPITTKPIPPVAMELAQIRKAFIFITDLIRLYPAMDDSARINNVRDGIAMLSAYLMKKNTKKQPIDEEIYELLASARGIDLVNWMLTRAEADRDAITPHDPIVIGRILEIRLKAFADNHQVSVEIAQFILFHAAAVTAFYEAVRWIWPLVSEAT